MANPEHLKILNQGIIAWNEWRKGNPDIEPDLSKANLRRRRLTELYVVPNGIDFNEIIELSYVNLNGADLSEAVLPLAVLDGANLVEANLTMTNFWNASLRGVNLSGARLDQAILKEAYLNHANLREADLTQADFTSASLNGADFSFAVIQGTTFCNNDLGVVEGLDSTRHHGPSYIDLDTFYRSGGRLPETFLRGCGVPEDLIIYMRSLITQPIQFYTCFISFTEADNAFSERIYNDMQAKGVRCWRWKEDAKWGKTLMRSVDEAVRLYDKLIVICSEQSLNSPAVIREIDRALQKEDDLIRRGKDSDVLFPIRLDDYIFTDWNHHRKADVMAKNIGDFTHWKEHDSYQKAFDRLLRDLKAEER